MTREEATNILNKWIEITKSSEDYNKDEGFLYTDIGTITYGDIEEAIKTLEQEPINHELFRKALKHRLYERYMDNPSEFKALCGLINDVESVIKHNAECWQEWRVKNEQNIF